MCRSRKSVHHFKRKLLVTVEMYRGIQFNKCSYFKSPDDKAKQVEFYAKLAVLSNIETVPKQCRFNQSKSACCFCARLARRFTCLPLRARDGELIKVQHSCYQYHADKIGHPNSSYITTKLYERLHVDATLLRSFQKELFSRFLPSPYAVHVSLAAGKPWLSV